MCGTLQLSSETCPQYSVVPGDQRLSQLSPFAPAFYLSQTEGAVRRGAGGLGRLRVHRIPPNPRLDSRCAPKGTGFAQRLSGETLASSPVPCLSAFQAWLLSTPCALAGPFCIYQSSEPGRGKELLLQSCGFALACASGCLLGSNCQDSAGATCTVPCKRRRVWRCALGA